MFIYGDIGDGGRRGSDIRLWGRYLRWGTSKCHTHISLHSFRC